MTVNFSLPFFPATWFLSDPWRAFRAGMESFLGRFASSVASALKKHKDPVRCCFASFNNTLSCEKASKVKIVLVTKPVRRPRSGSLSGEHVQVFGLSRPALVSSHYPAVPVSWSANHVWCSHCHKIPIQIFWRQKKQIFRLWSKFCSGIFLEDAYEGCVWQWGYLDRD